MTTGRQNPQDTTPELPESFYDEAPEGESTTDHDFDAWWAEHAASRPTTTILGVTIPIPSQVPAEIMLNPDAAMALDVKDTDEMIRLLEQMLDLTGIDGQLTVADWISRGLGSEQLLVIFTWSLINGMRPPGKSAVSFARVLRIVTDAEQGKALSPAPTNRAGRRAAASSRTAAGSKTTKKAAAPKRAAGRK